MSPEDKRATDIILDGHDPVPILSSSEKPITNGNSTLALFGSWLMSPKDKRATNIILDGHDPVLPGAAKITLIVLKGVLKEYLFETQSWLGTPDH